GDNQFGAGLTRGVPTDTGQGHQHSRYPRIAQFGCCINPGHDGTLRSCSTPTAGVGAVPSWWPRAVSIAQNTASGVAGEARSILVPGDPHAAAASRSASRTEKASRNGGSPTALDPYIAPSSCALSRRATLNSPGASEKLGIL